MSAASTANGRSFTVTLSFFPVKNAASSSSVPRATVPSTSGRALDPSAKNVVELSGRYFGWLCMSCRQPTDSASPTRASSSGLVRDLIDLSRAQSLEELGGAAPIELRVGGLDRQEEA